MINNTSSPTLAPVYKSAAHDRLLESQPKGSHLVVLGAGAFGGWAALMLLECGYKVTLVDPWGPGNSRSSSGGESRLIRMVYGDNLLYTQLATRSYHLWEKYQRLFGIPCLVPTGNLWFCKENDQTIKNAIGLLEQLELPYEKMPTEKLRGKFPEINPAGIDFVLHEQKTGFLYARQATMAVCDYFVKSGGTYLDKNPLFESLFETGDQLTFSDRSVIKAERYVFACGPWLPGIFPDWLGNRIEVTRQEIYYFGINADKASRLQQLPTWIDNTVEAHYYGVPNTALRGFKLAADVRGAVFDPTHGERVPSLDGVENAREYLAHRFPAMRNAPLLESRVCQYSNADGGNFIFDQHPKLPNIFALGGGSGHGFKHGPGVGEVVAKAFSGEMGMPSAWKVG